MKIKNTWSELLKDIRQRPAMFFGTANLQAFHHFFHGFQIAEMVYEITAPQKERVDDFPWQRFEVFVDKRFNLERLSLNSYGLAQYYAHGRGLSHFDIAEEYAGAWEIWWQWFDQFSKTE